MPVHYGRVDVLSNSNGAGTDPYVEFHPFSPQQTVNFTGTVMVKYTITNNSSKPHNLVIKPQTGISQTMPCALGPSRSANSSCILELNITGSELTASGISGGPVLCQSNPNGTPNLNQCYTPSQDNELRIVLITKTYMTDAVGYYFDDSFIQRPLLVFSQDSGATWTYPESITIPIFTPNNTYPFNNGRFSSVSTTTSLWLPKSLHFLYSKEA